VNGEGWRRRLRAAGHSFVASARNPAVRRIQLGFLGACTAEWAFTVVLSVYAFKEGGTEAVGLVSLVRMLPSALVAPFASAYLDRWRRDLALTAVSTIRCAATVAITLIAAAGGPPVSVYVLSVLSTAAALLYRPLNSALLPLLCRAPSELASANVVRGLLDSISTLVGPALAAALLASGSISSGFLAVAVISGLSAAVTLGLRVEEPERGTVRASVAAGLVRGAKVILGRSELRVMFLLIGAQTMVRGALSVFSVLVAVDLIGLGEPGVGTLTAAVGAGAIVGSVFASLFVGNRGLAAWFGAGVAIWGAPLVLLAIAPSEPAALALFALIGVGNALVDVGAFTLIARLAPERVLTRVYGLLECVGGLAVGAGSVLAAFLASQTSVRGSLAIVGAISPALVLLFWFTLRRLDDAMQARDEDLELLQRVAVFDPLPLPALEQLATGLEPLLVPAGETVYHQGDAAEGCFIIEQGQAQVLGDGQPIATVGPGDLVGEIALLRQVPRTATVQATTEMRLRLLDADRFVCVVTGWETSRELSRGHVDELLERFSPGSEPQPD
jgi:MFS family permease